MLNRELSRSRGPFGDPTAELLQAVHMACNLKVAT